MTLGELDHSFLGDSIENKVRWVNAAYAIAYKAHNGQTDLAGNPYIEHSIAVSNMMNTNAEKAVALLHDVVEDTTVTLNDLIKEGFPAAIIEAVDALTHHPNETYQEYLIRAKNNKIARKVKLADAFHNSDAGRQNLTGKQAEERAVKYYNAIEYLLE